MIDKHLTGIVKSEIKSSTSKTCVDLIVSNEAYASKQVNKAHFATTVSEINQYILTQLPGRHILHYDKSTTRDSLIKLITNFLSPNLEVKCAKCEFAGYSELPADYFTRPNLMCYECGSPSHRDCYENIIDPSIGILYRCTSCSPPAPQGINAAPATGEPPANENSETKGDKGGVVEDDEKKDETHPANLSKRKIFDRSLRICKFLRTNSTKNGEPMNKGGAAKRVNVTTSMLRYANLEALIGSARKQSVI
eukprot:sb/3468732/